VRALITGIGGFVGRHLLIHLRGCGDEVWGMGRAADHGGLPPDVPLFATDLLDRSEVEIALREAQPDVIYHLAAQSSTGESLGDPWATLANNLHAQMTLFEALLGAGQRPSVLVIGSGDEYGRVRPDEVPSDEQVPLRPTTPYAVSKVGQDVMGHQYWAQHRLPVVRVRPFNHTGPGQDARFVIPHFASQLAAIEARQVDPVLRVGNLDVWRDFTDVRDMVRAYRLATALGEPGEVYNLGSGEAVRIADIVDDLTSLCEAPVRVEVSPELLRPTDVPRQEADCARFRRLTNWQPAIPWHDTLRDTFQYWRQRVADQELAVPHAQQLSP
jgi:GDP-4-dehydro-6-deoxy-D-mannose reductase